MDVEQILKEINDYADRIGHKIGSGFFLRDVEHEVNEMKTRITMLTEHENPQIAHLARCMGLYLKELLKLQKMKESGKYSDRKLKRQLERTDRRREILIEAIKEVEENGIDS